LIRIFPWVAPSLPVRGVDKCRRSLLVDRILPRIPLGVLSLLLKSGQLPFVADGGEEFPDEEEKHPEEDDARYDPQDDRQDVHLRRTLWVFLYFHLQFIISVVEVGEVDKTAILIHIFTVIDSIGDFGFGGGVATLIVALLLRQIAVIESFTQRTAPMCTTLFLSTVITLLTLGSKVLRISTCALATLTGALVVT